MTQHKRIPLPSDYGRIVFASQIGSHLYGTATETSDVDIRGFLIPKIEYCLGFQKFEQYEDPMTDSVYYSIKKFVEMLYHGNTQALEAVFSNLIFTDVNGMHANLMFERQHFISKRYQNSMRGFALAEWRKAMGLQLVIDAKDDSKTKAIEALCGAFSLKRYERNLLLETLEQITNDKIKLEVSNPNLGDRRQAEFDQIGYCPKNASHTIRLLFQGVMLAKTHVLTYPLPAEVVTMLRNIKRGEIPKAELLKIYEHYTSLFDSAWATSSLPQNANVEALNKWCATQIREYI